MSRTETRNPEPPAIDAIRKAAPGIQRVMRAHGIIAPADEMAALTVLLGTAIADTAKASKGDPLATAERIVQGSADMLRRETAHQMRAGEPVQ